MSILIQILLAAVILTTTTLVAIAGIQVFHILREFRLALQKLNHIMDNTQSLSAASAKPITAVNEFFTEVKSLVNETQDEIIDSTPDRVVTPPHSLPVRAKPHRFFHRSGAALRPS